MNQINQQFYMPAEWQKHSAIWLSWPHGIATFPKLDKVEETYIKIITAIHTSEHVNLFVRDKAMQDKIMRLLNDVDLKKITFFFHDYADVWFRDYGPIFVTNGKELAITKWIFNAWGNKYEELIKDNDIPYIINKKLGLKLVDTRIVLEGGSIDVNGNGTLLTTEQCLLNPNRNHSLSKKEIEDNIKMHLGVKNIIWLKNGIEGDDTDGHIDDIARFVNESTVLCCYEEEDDNFEILKENYYILCNSKDQDGNSLKVIKLPMPGKVMCEHGRLPASYANFYIGNTVVLVPIFGHKNDSKALRIIQDQFPKRKVIGINCTDLVYGLGTLHCISQQQPII